MCHYRNAITTINLTTISMMLTNHKPGEKTENITAPSQDGEVHSTNHDVTNN
jgi:hypothetical protein